MMKAVLAYTKSEDAKPEDKRTLPEAKRVLDLLWDHTYGCRTTKWGIDPNDPLHVRCEGLYKRVALADFRRAIDLTRRAREPGAIKAAGNEGKDLAAHVSGEKLAALLRDETQVRRKKLGKAFGLPAEVRTEARALLRTVYKDQSRHARDFFLLIWPVLPPVIYGTLSASPIPSKHTC